MPEESEILEPYRTSVAIDLHYPWYWIHKPLVCSWNTHTFLDPVSSILCGMVCRR